MRCMVHAAEADWLLYRKLYRHLPDMFPPSVKLTPPTTICLGVQYQKKLNFITANESLFKSNSMLLNKQSKLHRILSKGKSSIACNATKTHRKQMSNKRYVSLSISLVTRLLQKAMIAVYNIITKEVAHFKKQPTTIGIS